MMMRSWLFCLLLAPACDQPGAVLFDAGPPDARPNSCWDKTCPQDAGALRCGTCTHWAADHECPPGFVCACSLDCVKGPRSYDGGVACVPDAGLPDGGVSTPAADAGGADAFIYEWSCDDTDPRKH